MKDLIISFLLICAGFSVYAITPESLGKVTVEVDYGTDKPEKVVEVEWSENMSALEALQKSSIVVTHPVAGYVFVTSIDEVTASRGNMAWYYKVNGESATNLAISQPVNPDDIVSWIFIEDVCSKTVDE